MDQTAIHKILRLNWRLMHMVHFEVREASTQFWRRMDEIEWELDQIQKEREQIQQERAKAERDAKKAAKEAKRAAKEAEKLEWKRKNHDRLVQERADEELARAAAYLRAMQDYEYDEQCSFCGG